MTEVIINDFSIQAKDVQIVDAEQKKLKIVFDVTHEMYHDVTVLLYKKDFFVKVPQEGLAFHGTINQYYTSVTDLYEKGAVGEFTVEFIKKSLD